MRYYILSILSYLILLRTKLHYYIHLIDWGEKQVLTMVINLSKFIQLLSGKTGI